MTQLYFSWIWWAKMFLIVSFQVKKLAHRWLRHLYWNILIFRHILFQELLQIYRETIKDASVIQCVKRENDDTIFYPVLALKRNDVCISIEYTIQPIDMLSVFLAISVIFIVFKLIYDYYNFRAYGHLPWIVTKMPW